MAGLEPREFSAQGLRSGYLTEAARQGVALPGAMQQSQHRSVQQAASYYNDAGRAKGRHPAYIRLEVRRRSNSKNVVC